MTRIFYNASLRYWQGEVYLEFVKYSNGRIAIQLWNAEEGPIAKATINVPEANLQAGEIIVKDYSENEGVVEFLISNNIATLTKRNIDNGYVVCPVMKLTPEILNTYNLS